MSYLRLFLIGDVPLKRRFGSRADRPHLLTPTRESRHAGFEPRKFFSKFVRCESLALSRQVCGSQPGVRRNEQVNVTRQNLPGVNLRFQFLGLLVQELPKPLLNCPDERLQSTLGTPTRVILERIDRPSTDSATSIHHGLRESTEIRYMREMNRRVALPAS